MIFKKWRERKAEDFRVWMAEYLFKTHIQPTLNHVNHVVDHSSEQVFQALRQATEANERSAELGRLIGQLQKQVDAVAIGTRYLAEMADDHIAKGH